MHNPTAYALGTHRSCIRELFEYGRQRATLVGEENVFDFSLGNPCIPAPREVNDTVAKLLRETDSLTLHGYTTAVGDPAARQAIAEDLNRRYGTDITKEELFIGCGAAPELCAVFRALAVPGGEILVLAPYFPEYKPFAEDCGLTVTVAPAAEDFQISIPNVETMLTPNTVAVVVNSPNNPSGVVYSKENLSHLAALLTEKSGEYGHPIYIVADEPYRELAYDGVEVPFIPTLYPNTVVCYSYSKSLSLPGERIGYIYVPRQADGGKDLYAAVCGGARAIGHVCAPSLWQKVVAECTHLRPDLSTYDRNRRTLYEGLLAAGYEAVRPDGAFYLFVKAPNGDGVAFSELCKQKDILVVPSDGFGCSGWVRICYCVSLKKIQRSLPLFRQLMEQIKE